MDFVMVKVTSCKHCGFNRKTSSGPCEFWSCSKKGGREIGPGGIESRGDEPKIPSWCPFRKKRFNTIYFDIWPTISEDNLPEITKLKRKFARSVEREDPYC